MCMLKLLFYNHVNDAFPRIYMRIVTFRVIRYFKRYYEIEKRHKVST